MRDDYDDNAIAEDRRQALCGLIESLAQRLRVEAPAESVQLLAGASVALPSSMLATPPSPLPSPSLAPSPPPLPSPSLVPSPKELESMLREASKRLADPSRRISKKELLSFYLAQKSAGTAIWRGWADADLVDGAVDEAMVKLLRAKPRRTASGVATVTVLTKPWPCAGDCVCCPNDVRMPKSYLSDEPACQRAERCWFDPYLQMTARLRVLADMGHNIDKVEMIVLGGTFSDYPLGYRVWFVEQLFEALNDFGSDEGDSKFSARCRFYEGLGLACDAAALRKEVEPLQRRVDAGEVSYNEAVGIRNAAPSWREVASIQSCELSRLEEQHRANGGAAHRSVGLCVETRPELITPDHLVHLRELGCTKLQIGVQSLSPEVLSAMGRENDVDAVVRAMALMRLFGFKSHVHMMANLPGSTPDSDKLGYGSLVGDAPFMPDEVKLYPCALVESSHLMGLHGSGEWRPYTEAELLDVLACDLLATPCHTRVSRMIRDISSKDIVAGNKKTNLRQLVEQLAGKRACASGGIREMRSREISTSDVSPSGLRMDEHRYETTNTDEVFIQHVDADGRLVAFCRLSMPHLQDVRALHAEMLDGVKRASSACGCECADGDDGRGEHGERDGRDGRGERGERGRPIREGEAMIREVHVYGRVSKLHESKEGSQHLGLGRSLVERACEIAAQRGYGSIAVISAVGTRDYYRKLGFVDGGLYLRRSLD